MYVPPEEARAAFEKAQLVADQNEPLPVAEDALLFGADFLRAGPDLILRNAGADDIRITDYFRNSEPADLLGPDGGVLPGAWVAQLAGPEAPGQYAQAGGAGAAEVIGQVETFGGSASVQRVDGTEEALGEGSNIFLGDVVSTGRGGSLSITFVDGTIFTLSAESRMVIDDLVYAPAGDQNSATFNLIQGGFVFVAGQIAPTGGMEVNTPAATMGIRGTTVLAELRTEGGVAVSEIALAEDPETGNIGRIELFDRAGNLLAEVTQTETKYIITSGGEITEVARSAEDEEADNILLQELLEAFEEAAIRFEQSGNFVELNGNSAGPGTSADQGLAPETPGEETPEDVELDSQDEVAPPPEEVPEEAPVEEESFDEGRLENNDMIQTANLEVTSSRSDAQGAVIEDQTTSTSGQLSATGENVAWSGSSEGTLGDFKIDETGQWVYDTNAAADQLSEGEQTTETFTATVTDDEGATATQDVVVTITGTNDAPIIISDESEARGRATENTAPLASGTLAATDADARSSLTWSGSAQGAFGAFEISESGDWTYAATASAEGLADGQVVTETFTAVVSDDQGAAVSQEVTITLTGTNDAPKITSEIGAPPLLTEDVATTASGQITATDVDAGTNLVFSAPAQGSYGAFSIDGQGNWAYALSAEADRIADGQVVTETITITVSDGQGGQATQDIDIRIVGTNDAPVVTTAPGAKTGDIDLSVSTTAQGQLTASDPDAASSGSDATSRGTRALADDDGLVWSGSAAGTFGTFTVDADGKWTYEATLGENLAEGQNATESFVATVTDTNGGTATETVTINLTGTNEAPVVTAGETSGSVVENTVPSAAGQLVASDPDAGAALTWSGSAAGVYGAFAISADGAWDYSLNAAAEALAEGQVVTETFTATVTDDQGAAASETVTITITGTNDAPIVTASDTSGSVTENSDPAASGQLNATDADEGADAGATLLWSGSAEGAYGAFAIAEDGAWTYTTNARAEALAQGQVVTETFTATVTDDQGAPASQVVTLTVTGTNDAPVVGESDTTGAVTEDIAATASGQLNASDADADAVLIWSGSTLGAFGIFSITESGAWTYTLTAGADSLAAGETATETFTATVTDDQGATAFESVTISLTGTNDAPVIGEGDRTGSVVENISPSTSGQLSATDADAGASLFWTGSVAGAYGGFTIIETGEWSYTAGPGAEALAAGQMVTETFTATVQDDQGATASETITITITGTNDIPVIAEGGSSGSVTENTAPATSGQLVASDADAGAVLVWSGAAIGAYGLFDISEDGLWSYTANTAAESLAAGQTVTETFTATVTDDQGASASQDVRITLTGTNDAPVITSETLTYAEGITTGRLSAQDADAGDSLTFSLVDETMAGLITLGADGAFTYQPTQAFPGIDAFDYAVTDSQGAMTQGRMTLLGQSEPLVLFNGDVLDIDLSPDASASAPAGHAILTQSQPDAFALNIVLAFDTTTALSPAEWARQLDETSEALQVIRPALQTAGVPVAVHIVTFAASAQFVGSFDLFDENLLERLDALQQTNETDASVSAALAETDAILNGTGQAETSYAYLFSGAPLPPEAAEAVYAVEQVNTSPAGSVSPFLFEETTFATFDQALADLIPEALSLHLIADGVDLGEIADASDLSATVGADGISYALAELPGLADLLGEENLFAFSATVAPFFNDFGTFELGASEVFSKAGAAQSLQGSAGADLLLGSDAGDDISAGDGADIVLGFAGNDLIDAGTGADTVRAGAGDDTIRVDTSEGLLGTQVDGGDGLDVLALAGTQVDTALEAIDLSGIETLDIANGQTDTLTLSVEDVLDLVQPADAELEALLESALPPSLTIQGDAGDTVNLGPNAQATGQTALDATGNTLNIYSFSDGSDVLATLAIDADVTVATQTVAS